MSPISKEADALPVIEATSRVYSSLPPPHRCVPIRSRHHSRDADLKEIVLDQLLAQHDDAQLDAELHEAAARGTLWGRGPVRSGLALDWEGWPSTYRVTHGLLKVRFGAKEMEDG